MLHRSKAVIITIGDEILYGQTLDTNSHWISQRLDEIGIKTLKKVTIGDQESEILDALKGAESNVDIVLITGGLGPTSDDLTKPALAKYFKVEMEIHPEALEHVTVFFKKFGKDLTETNRDQAALPTNCEMIPNPYGTAPGMWFYERETVFMSMPGVPREMKKMMVDQVIPKIISKFNPDPVYHKIVKTVGIGESYLADIIRDWENNLPEHIKLAYLPDLGEVKLRLTALGNDLEKLKREVKNETEKLWPLIGKNIYGEDDDNYYEIIGKLLLNLKRTIATAESCTGGYLAHKITSIAGSSAYFQGGIIPYHNQFKINHLQVKPETLDNEGAVSESAVIQMAESVRERFDADFGLATSGVAGPSGGTEEKPVGTVWVAVSSSQKNKTRKLSFGHTREVNIHLSTLAVTNLLRQILIEIG